MRAISAPTLLPLGHPVDAADVRTLVDAVADAGFDGAQMTSSHLAGAVADGMTPEEFFGYHRDRGLAIPTVEVLMEWVTADRQEIAEQARPLLDIAQWAGSPTVIATTLEAEVPSIAGVAERLAYLCDLAAERGLRISFEFLPWSVVPNIRAAMRLLDAVDRDNLGLVVDMWHWFRQPGGPDYDTLRDVPTERIHVLQLCDAPTRPADDLRTETIIARLLPGDGDADIEAVLDVLVATGADPLVATEVYSASLAGLGPAEMARRAFAATETVLGGRFPSHGTSG
ncbi:Xylose isomerase domain protein TIM barrel [Parafrankia sp. EAN1pec]|uniref:sugar phosphate isomerase/epimerase family protein n=1 Tax=Parafrankia sp. (strain EAN1pec) TaxID=298653 RepID=UPI0000540984|nr:Xylose isomerase domain protein TIM barrel [Frankia sp. EAN1pec]